MIRTQRNKTYRITVLSYIHANSCYMILVELLGISLSETQQTTDCDTSHAAIGRTVDVGHCCSVPISVNVQL
jgi:hypothetical protein